MAGHPDDAHGAPDAPAPSEHPAERQMRFLFALRSRGVPILGVAFVGDAVEDSEATIAAIGGVRRLGRLPRLATLTRETLAEAFAAHFDVEDFR